MLTEFRNALQSENPTETIRNGLIGEGLSYPGRYGDVPMIYADYVASGRALKQVEAFMLEKVLPFYANPHTEDSYCGAYVNKLREQSRAEIARLTKAEGCAVVFTGSGASAGLGRLPALLGVEEAENPVVLLGPYEHHSNLLPWRESKALVIEIPEGADGGPDLAILEEVLQKHQGSDLLIGSFSAASNVTGILTDVAPVTRLIKAYGGVSVWDYAGGAPYLSIDMATGTDAEKDVVVASAHKFPGGPGGSGVMILRPSVVRRQTPTQPGGGTVRFVSPWGHDYLEDVVAREEAGTPNLSGDIRAALAFIVKDVIGQSTIDTRERELNVMAKAGLGGLENLTILGVDNRHRLPIFSMLVRDGAGNIVSSEQITRDLSEIYGIQARGGCACAGPYGHRLLHVDKESSAEMRCQILAGHDELKPGWVRLNFSYLMSDETVRYIIISLQTLVRSYAQEAA
ncbi:MAG: aminotransferase class V-fold PLP-dependent enzyme [Rhodobacteraceae bacterium]|nr:aminotransferase class V-fold PLP-dependent enzyme [Paracoccaceae bacterium]